MANDTVFDMYFYGMILLYLHHLLFYQAAHTLLDLLAA